MCVCVCVLFFFIIFYSNSFREGPVDDVKQSDVKAAARKLTRIWSTLLLTLLPSSI